MQRKSDAKLLKSEFLDRWSPRAMRSQAIEPEKVEALFEAARWSPSCFNDQPWFFAYAQSTEDLNEFQTILVEGNQVWANKAPLLIAAFARRHFAHNGQPNKWAPFDVGAAWMAMALQARSMSLYCHAMAGFHEDKIYSVTGVDPEKYEALCMIAVGYQGDAQDLPSDLREREEPNARKPAREFLTEGPLKE